jgi:hypothetical protein
MQDRHLGSCEVHRANPVFRLVGTAGLVFWTYVFLYNAGVIPLALFEHVGDASLSAASSWVLYSVMTAMALILLWLSANRITITNEEVVYSAPLRRIAIRWDEVTRVQLAPASQFEVWSVRSRIRAYFYYERLGRLRSEVLSRVDHSVVQEHRSWWQRW